MDPFISATRVFPTVQVGFIGKHALFLYIRNDIVGNTGLLHSKTDRNSHSGFGTVFRLFLFAQSIRYFRKSGGARRRSFQLQSRTGLFTGLRIIGNAISFCIGIVFACTILTIHVGICKAAFPYASVMLKRTGTECCLRICMRFCNHLRTRRKFTFWIARIVAIDLKRT